MASQASLLEFLVAHPKISSSSWKSVLKAKICATSKPSHTELWGSLESCGNHKIKMASRCCQYGLLVKPLIVKTAWNRVELRKRKEEKLRKSNKTSNLIIWQAILKAKLSSLIGYSLVEILHKSIKSNARNLVRKAKYCHFSSTGFLLLASS